MAMLKKTLLEKLPMVILGTLLDNQARSRLFSFLEICPLGFLVLLFHCRVRTRHFSGKVSLRFFGMTHKWRWTYTFYAVSDPLGYPVNER